MPKPYKSSSIEKEPYRFVEKVDEVKHAEPPKIAVKNSIDARVIATGNVTGNRYEFNGAGSVVDVDERDVEYLLNKRQGGRQCCGGTDNGNTVFVLAEVI